MHLRTIDDGDVLVHSRGFSDLRGGREGDPDPDDEEPVQS